MNLIRYFVGMMPYFWQNGRRPLVALSAALAVALVLVTTVWLWPQPDVTCPLVVGSPFSVLAGEVAVGGTLRYQNDTCNVTNEPISVIFRASWVRHDEEIVVISGGSGSFVNEPGCHHNEVEIPLPAYITPGRWYRAGVVDFTHDEQAYSIEYRTESFEVVEPNEQN